MDNKELKKTLLDLKAKIIANSKDAHFADSLINELLSVKGQLCVEPLALNCGKVIKEYTSDVYCVSVTDRGVLYHEYGGYNIFVSPSHTALYNVLADMVFEQEERKNAIGEEKERIELLQTAVGWVLQAPKIALVDAAFTLDIATKTVSFLNKTYDELSQQELQLETIEADEQFRQASLALEELKEEANKN